MYVQLYVFIILYSYWIATNIITPLPNLAEWVLSSVLSSVCLSVPLLVAEYLIKDTSWAHLTIPQYHLGQDQ